MSAVSKCSVMRIPRRRGGFTIIELLVVIAILAVLFSAVIAILSGARTKSRDARRETDIKTIQNALELYLTNARVYPATGGGGVCLGATDGSDTVSPALIAAEAIGRVPKDPQHDCGGNLHYHYTATDPSTYILRFYVETASTGRDPSQPVTVGP